MTLTMISSFLVAAVFATAGAAKLRDPAGSREALRGFGVPAPLLAPLGVAVPVAELAAAVALLVGPTRTWGAWGALALLTGFSLAIGWNLSRGRTPECHCFGQLHSAPASRRTLLRNGAVLTLAAFVASGGEAAWSVAAAAAALATIGLVGILSPDRRARGTERTGEGLARRTPAPDFELPSATGGTVSLAALRERRRPVLLVFTDPDCGPCIALAPVIGAWQHEHADRLTIAVIESRDGSTPDPAVDEHGRRDVLLQRGREVAESYDAQGTPSAVLVSDDGRIASGVAAGGPAIEALVAETVPLEGDWRLGAAVPLAVPLVRRELLARAVATWAGITGLLSPPAWAGQLELKCRYERCEDRCCPKKAKCRRVGGRRVCVCPDGRPACGNRCCPDTFVCRRFRRKGRLRSRCVCPDGHVVCAGRCVPRTDPRHCGGCGNQCPPATSCVGGECVGGDGSGSGPGGSGACDCPPGETCCEGQCTDLNTNDAHCGMCGQPCAEGQTCCDGVCRDLQTDPRNCGTCRKRCPSDEVCSEGQCGRRCRGGLKNCKGRCVDVKSNDPSNCGSCGRTCSEGYTCCEGVCCGGDTTCCPGGCKYLGLDEQNCGGCGNVCGPNEFCRFGVCTCPPGYEC